MRILKLFFICSILLNCNSNNNLRIDYYDNSVPVNVIEEENYYLDGINYNNQTAFLFNSDSLRNQISLPKEISLMRVNNSETDLIKVWSVVHDLDYINYVNNSLSFLNKNTLRFLLKIENKIPSADDLHFIYFVNYNKNLFSYEFFIPQMSVDIPIQVDSFKKTSEDSEKFLLTIEPEIRKIVKKDLEEMFCHIKE